MNENKQSISARELEILISRRDSLSHDLSDLTIRNKIITDAFKMLGRINTNFGVYVAPVKLIDCEFLDSVNIGDASNAGQITFSNCVFKKEVNIIIDNSDISNENFFENDLKIRIEKTSEVVLSNLLISGTLVISGSLNSLTLSKIITRNQDIKPSINITAEINKIIFKDFSINNIIFTGNIKNMCELTNIVVSNELNVLGSLNGRFNITDSTIQEIMFSRSQTASKKVEIINCKIASFNHSIGYLNYLSLNKCIIQSLKLSGSNEQNQIINIQETSVESFILENVFNNGLITLRELRIPTNGLFVFRSSNMGKMDFIYCNFSKASLEFQNSKISEAFFSETEFPKKVLVDGKLNYPQAQLTFSQLAVAFQKQGDNIRALEYGSRELEAHFKSIRWNRKHFITTLNLFLNYISNNFGRNWLQGAIFSFAIGFVIFCLLLVSTDKFQLGIPTLKYDLLPTYLKFMNPLRFYELETLFNNTPYEKTIKLEPNSYLADFWGRVFIAYGFYQTIQAFRRFGRK